MIKDITKTREIIFDIQTIIATWEFRILIQGFLILFIGWLLFRVWAESPDWFRYFYILVIMKTVANYIIAMVNQNHIYVKKKLKENAKHKSNG